MLLRAARPPRRRGGWRRRLGDCHGKLVWPARGVYFFFEDGEQRKDTGTGDRVVRVGTHGLKAGSKATLWKRLSQHRGRVKTGGGDHRGLVFRLHVGTALLGADPALRCASWTEERLTAATALTAERELEAAVSQTIRQMRVLWIAVDDEPGPRSERATIESNAVALLSNWRKPGLDPPSAHWLGHRCRNERVQQSGLWNHDHVDAMCEDGFLDDLERVIDDLR